MPSDWLTGPRVALREYGEGDLDAVLRYAADPEVTRYLPWGPDSPEEAAAFLARVVAQANLRPRTQYEVAVVLRASGELIGAARLGLSPAHGRRGDIGYVVRRDMWRQGVATEAARLLLGFGFAVLGLHRIEATCDPDNVASRRVLEKLGMQFEGRLRDDLPMRDGWRDSLLFSILEGEWRARQP